MLLTKRYCVSITLLILFSCMAGLSFAQPSLLSRTLTIQVTNAPISSVIEKIGKQTGVRFSYNPSQLPASKKVSLNLKNQTVETALKSLFAGTDYQFKEIGNQLVIFKVTPPLVDAEPPKKEPTDKEKAEPQNKSPQQVKQRNTVRDTVYLFLTDTLILHKTDTLLITDLIIQHDTIVRTDTIFLEKPGSQVQGKDDVMKTEIVKDQIIPNLDKIGWYTGIAYEQLWSKSLYSANDPGNDQLREKMSGATHFTPQNYAIHALIGYDFTKAGLRTGISYTRLGENFEYSYTRQIGGYYKTDTVETYYTIAGIDTSWYYVTDSSWVNIDYKNYTYKNPNYYRYVEIPFSVKFNFLNRPKLNCYAIGGVVAGFNFGRKALYILPEEDLPVKWISGPEMSPFMFSWQAGLGGEYRIGSKLRIFSEVKYRKQLTDFYKDYPLDKKFELLNIKTGIFVWLK
jgi:hypothetical protein